MKRMFSLLPFLMLLALAACNRTPVIEVEKETGDPFKENMINANKLIAQSEETQIDAYVTRRGWTMHPLSNGSRIEEYKPGDGTKVDYEDTITVVYRLEAINGSVFYEAAQETFVVGRHKPTVGLDRAVLELRRGSQARLILPSELGYGVVGDGDRVPSRAILIYDLKILEK